MTAKTTFRCLSSISSRSLLPRKMRNFSAAMDNLPCAFEPEAMQILMDHNWPGNVRELENVVERAVVLTTASSVPAHVLPDHLQQASGMRITRDRSGMLAPDASLFEVVADFERRKIIEALEARQLQPDGSG